MRTPVRPFCFNKRRFLQASLVRWMVMAFLPGIVFLGGCHNTARPAAPQAAHAGDANQQTLRQSRDILSRRSAVLRAKRAQSAARMPAK